MSVATLRMITLLTIIGTFTLCAMILGYLPTN